MIFLKVAELKYGCLLNYITELHSRLKSFISLVPVVVDGSLFHVLHWIVFEIPNSVTLQLSFMLIPFTEYVCKQQRKQSNLPCKTY